MTTSIGERMKRNYEDVSRFYLLRRTPVIIRVDGRAFHTLTRRHCEKPFDARFIDSMRTTALYLVGQIQGAKCAYVQSDEISILVSDFDTLDASAWFFYNVQKMASVSASMATLAFERAFNTNHDTYDIHFDARAFNIPREEVVNYFIWRQKDWNRNSIQMLARSLVPEYIQEHTPGIKARDILHKKNRTDLHDFCMACGVNWNDLDLHLKNGTFIVRDPETGKWTANGAPTFTEHRDVIEQFLVDNP